MARYIDADRLINEFTSNSGIFVYGIDTVKAIISRVNVQPVANVVPLVRCKDCKWFGVDRKKGGFCMRNDSPSMWRNETGELKPEDYCSYGIRSEQL